MKKGGDSLIWILLVCLPALFGCKKYLDGKSDKKLVIPAKVSELQALLDDYTVVNQAQPGVSEVSADNYYLTTTDWEGLYSDDQRRVYTWEKDFLFPLVNNDWSALYEFNVYRANIVLDNISNIPRVSSNQTVWDNVRGHALFLRGMAFMKAAFVWSLAYDKSTADHDLGVPLRLNSDFNIPSVRATNEATYQQIISDLRESASLLPAIPLQVLRPSQPAAYGLLARTFLSMREYDSCFKYADLCLRSQHTLMDYNNDPSIDPGANYPFTRFNPEVIMDSYIISSTTELLVSVAKIDSFLYKSYSDGDLRKSLFFQSNGPGTYGFKGSYAGLDPSVSFDGIAVDEIYLMRAECLARSGDVEGAMHDLNLLLAKRWDSLQFVPAHADNAEDALQIILTERRKELIFRQLRWMDIKRLNKEGANISLTRLVNNQVYVLPPNDLRFALPIPEEVISISQMLQNPR